jgi:hypothetical protein
MLRRALLLSNDVRPAPASRASLAYGVKSCYLEASGVRRRRRVGIKSTIISIIARGEM